MDLTGTTFQNSRRISFESLGRGGVGLAAVTNAEYRVALAPEGDGIDREPVQLDLGHAMFPNFCVIWREIGAGNPGGAFDFLEKP